MITSNVRQVTVRMGKRTANLSALSKRFFERKRTPYHMEAGKILYDVVYGDPDKPKQYERTFELFNSLDSELITDGMRIYLNPNKGSIRAEYPGAQQYYPAYVMRGAWLWDVDYPARDFMEGWVQTVGETFKREFGQDVTKALRP